MLCSIKPILSWKADQDSLICTLTVRLSNLCRDISHELSSREGSGVVGWRQNDQAIIEELENNPVMIDQFLIGWDWLLTGLNLSSIIKMYFIWTLRPSSVFSPKSVLDLTKHFFPVTTWDLVETAPAVQHHHKQLQIVSLFSTSPNLT